MKIMVRISFQIIYKMENKQMYRKISAKAKLQWKNFEAIKSFQSGKPPGLIGIPAYTKSSIVRLF
jgi:hypothetical protein